MSWMTKDELVKRLEYTNEESPLAAFCNDLKGKRFEGLYDVAFANTVVTQKRIEQGDFCFGSFHRGNMTEARKALQKYEQLSEAA